MDKYNFSIVISAFGNKLDIFLDSLKNSIYTFHPDIEIRVYGKNEEKELKQIKEIKNKSKFCSISPGSLKIIFWNKGLIDANTEWILFLDADTLILKPLDYLFEFCLSNKIDFLFSWREKNEIFVNSGVMLVRKNESTLNFFSRYKNRVLQDVLNEKNDQQSFIKLLSENETFKSIRNNKYGKKEFIFYYEKINFGSLPCKIMNNSYSNKELNDQTLIQHYKGVLGTIILKDDKDNRYKKLLKYDLFRFSSKDIRRINHKLELWRSFSELDNNDLPIDIYNYYKRKKYKRFFVIFFDLIIKTCKPIRNKIKSYISLFKKLN